MEPTLSFTVKIVVYESTGDVRVNHDNVNHSKLIILKRFFIILTNPLELLGNILPYFTNILRSMYHKIIDTNSPFKILVSKPSSYE